MGIAVSTSRMAPRKVWFKRIRIFAAVIFTLLVGLAVSVPIQQRVLRWRAERLLADIRALELGKSNWSDAQRFMHRWGAWGENEGSCATERCSYQVVLSDAAAWFGGKLPAAYWAWGFRPYVLLGGRYAMASARIEVINGVVWGKDFGLVVEGTGPGGTLTNGYVLLADADTVWRTQNNNFGQWMHPEYRVGHPGGCTFCERVFARFTPYTDARTINGLMDFNLDCLTRRYPCLHQIDIMPSVWTRVLAEEKTAEDEHKDGRNPFAMCSSSPEFLGRDRANVVVAQVDSVKASSAENTYLDVSFHLADRLKRARFWAPDATWNSHLPKEPNSNIRASRFKTGEKYILMFGTPSNSEWGDWIDLDPCGPIPLTEENLAAVRRGIRLDIFPESRNY